MSRFFNPSLAALVPYVPGEQPRDARDWVKLNTNESPYPPSPAVLRVINSGEAERLRLYSDPTCSDFLAALARHSGLSQSQVFAGNGSDEVLAFAFIAFCEGGAVFPDLSYGFYPVYAQLFHAEPTIVPLLDDFSLNVDDYAGKPGTVFIANPNAPTGISLPNSEIARLLSQDRDRLVVVDEAYVDFGGESCLPLLEDYDNLLIIGTFSKSRSLAGARLGYALGSEALITDLNTVKFSFNPYNINRLTLMAGAAALSDQGYYDDCANNIMSTRALASAELEKMGFCLTDSRANFIFARCPEGLSGGDYQRRLKEKGVLIRHWDSPRIANHVRITVGTPAQMQALISATREILEVG